jgi:YVTN family beta-propeller protein
MKLTSQAPLRVTAAAITGTAILVPAAMALAACAAGAGSPASAARPAGPVTAYVANYNSDTVTPINTATNTALKPIKVGSNPQAIAITP